LPRGRAGFCAGSTCLGFCSPHVGIAEQARIQAEITAYRSSERSKWWPKWLMPRIWNINQKN
jgi:hypothetical protein